MYWMYCTVCNVKVQPTKPDFDTVDGWMSIQKNTQECFSYVFYYMLRESSKTEHLKVIFSPSEEHVIWCQHVSKKLTYLAGSIWILYIKIFNKQISQKQPLTDRFQVNKGTACTCHSQHYYIYTHNTMTCCVDRISLLPSALGYHRWWLWFVVLSGSIQVVCCFLLVYLLLLFYCCILHCSDLWFISRLMNFNY